MWKKLPAKRIVNLHDVTEDFPLAVHYAEGQTLPRGARGSEIATYTVGGVAKVIEKHNATGKVSVHFEVNRNGVVSIEKAEMQIEVLELIPEKKIKAKKNATNATVVNATDSGEETEAEGEEDSYSDTTPVVENRRLRANDAAPRRTQACPEGTFHQPPAEPRREQLDERRESQCVSQHVVAAG